MKMKPNFRIAATSGVAVPSMISLPKDSATVLERGQFVALDASGLAITATPSSVKIAYATNGAEEGSTQVQVVSDADVIFVGTADTAYLQATHADTQVDIAVDGNGDQLIDLGASTTDVFIVQPDNFPREGLTTEIKVKINPSKLIGN